eukprot:4861010-Prorocentrum_lima.AAC.1
MSLPSQEAYPASPNQPCSYCRHHSSHAYFESMEPDTDTDSNVSDLENDEEYQALINNYDKAE